MWYNISKDFYYDEEHFLYRDLRDIIENYSDLFRPDEVINDSYPPVNYFDEIFYPAEIIRALSDDLYQELWDNSMDDWIEESIFRLNYFEPEEGDSIAELLEEDYDGLENIVWKN